MKYTPLGRCETPGQALEWASKLEPAYRAEKWIWAKGIPNSGRILEMIHSLMRHAQENIATKQGRNDISSGGLRLHIEDGGGITLLAVEPLARHIPDWPR